VRTRASAAAAALLALALGCTAPPAPAAATHTDPPPSRAFACGICGGEITGKYVSVEDELVYHVPCYEKARRCDACGLPAAGSRGPAYVSPDHRVSCSVCQKEAVLSDDEANEVARVARAALADVLKIDLRSVPAPVALVLKPELQAKAGALSSNWIKGLTEVEEEGAADGRRGARHYRIWALSGLPRRILVGVLAHELFHVFQSELNAEAGTADLPFREGAANYVEVRVLRSRGETLRARLLEKQGDAVYGEGLRRFERMAKELGERRALELGAKMQGFPEGY